MIKTILYIHHDCGLGGAPTSLSILMKNLDKKKYKPKVLLIRDGPVRELFESLDIEVLYFKKMHPFHGTTVSGMNFKYFILNIIKYFITIFRAIKVLKKINYDLLHLNTTCLFAFAQVSKIIKPNIPIISHIREPLLPNFYGSILRFFNKRYVDYFIAITNFDAKSFDNSIKNISVIYNCSDIDQYYSTVNKTQQIKNKVFTCLFLSRVSPENGVDTLLKAIKHINKNYPHLNIQYLIYGFPYISNDYVESLKLNKSSNTKFIKITKNTLKALAISDVQISPYKEPHFSRAVIEAALLGIPSIISNVKCLNEEVINNKTGLVFEKSNFFELAEKILLLYNNNKLLQDLGENAKSYADNQFSIIVAQKKIENIYQNILII